MMITTFARASSATSILLCALLSCQHSSVCSAQSSDEAPAAESSDDQAAPESGTEQDTAEDAAKEKEAEEEDFDLGAEVDRLIAKLDARRLKDRQGAEQALIELGAQALPLLPSELDLPSAEMRQRLKRIRKQLENIQSNVSIDATPVTIANALKVGDALKQITRQTRVKFDGGYNEDAAVVVDLKKVPLWTAVDEVLDQANLDVNIFGGLENTLSLEARQPGRPSRSDTAAYSGVFRVEATSLLSRRDLHNPNLNGLDVTLDIAWEPRLTPIGISLPLKDVTAKLDDGATLELQDSTELANAMPSSESPASQTILPFKLPAGRPVKIDTLTGKIDALLPGTVKKFDFDLGTPSFKPREAGEVSVHVESVTPNGTLHEIRVLVKFLKSDKALESHRGWVFDNPSYVRRNDLVVKSDPDLGPAAKDEDADSEISLPVGDPNRIENLGYEVYRQTSDELGIGFLFDLDGDPSSFTYRYETPANIIRSKVDFTLHDITLP